MALWLLWWVIVLRWQEYSPIGECSRGDPRLPILVNDTPLLASDRVKGRIDGKSFGAEWLRNDIAHERHGKYAIDNGLSFHP